MTTKEYMPEVGDVCEVYNRGIIGWGVIEINAIGKDFLLADERGHEVVLKKTCQFRPLKTQQEIEREEAIEGITTILRESPIYTDMAEKLYDAGYRKLGDEVTSRELHDFISVSAEYGDLAVDIYDAGYRKVGDEVTSKELHDLMIKEGGYCLNDRLIEKYKIYPRGE
tara:strand:- start:1103 stop:1606 length:504 start_codon:yes stop_codon:yes gene_type:complete